MFDLDSLHSAKHANWCRLLVKRKFKTLTLDLGDSAKKKEVGAGEQSENCRLGQKGFEKVFNVSLSSAGESMEV